MSGGSCGPPPVVLSPRILLFDLQLPLAVQEYIHIMCFLSSLIFLLFLTLTCVSAGINVFRCCLHLSSRATTLTRSPLPLWLMVCKFNIISRHLFIHYVFHVWTSYTRCETVFVSTIWIWIFTLSSRTQVTTFHWTNFLFPRLSHVSSRAPPRTTVMDGQRVSEFLPLSKSSRVRFESV